MYIRVFSSAVLGIDAYIMEVEIDLSQGMPAFLIVGLPDPSVKESRDRVRAALKNNGYLFPIKQITVNLAPADIPKEGPSLDLPIAIGLLATSGQVESKIRSAVRQKAWSSASNSRMQDSFASVIVGSAASSGQSLFGPDTWPSRVNCSAMASC